MSQNEQTSSRVASIAARILHANADVGIMIGREYFSWDDIQTVAASALTQAQDKKSDVQVNEPHI
jgi:hypothetical protein